MYEVEIYLKDGKYCAYIGGENASGYEITADTASECAKQIGEYFAHYGEFVEDMED